MDWHGEKRYAIYENFQLANEQVRNGERSDLLALVCEGGAAAYAASDQYQRLYLQLCKTCLLCFPGLPSLSDWQTALGSGTWTWDFFFTTEWPGQWVTGSYVCALLLTLPLNREQFPTTGHRDSHMYLPLAPWLKESSVSEKTLRVWTSATKWNPVLLLPKRVS